jgi:uncharacterized protein YkwD
MIEVAQFTPSGAWHKAAVVASFLLSVLTATGCGPRPAAGLGTEKPKGPLSLEEARRYVLDLVNRDRAEEGLLPVELDDAASRAAQRHSDDMAAHGFTAHLGTDGSVPEERLSDAGANDMGQENAACFFDGVARELDPNPLFLPELLEKIEYAFISEVPPNDGHRKNILRKVHNKLGVGLSKPLGIDEPCMAQEFIDDYGDYGELPKQAKLGQRVVVSGEVRPPMRFGAVGIARIEPAKPLSPATLNGTGGYTFPKPSELYFPAGFKTPKPVKVDGTRFSIEVTLDQRRKPGRYEISIWGNQPEDGNALEMIGLSVIDVR